MADKNDKGKDEFEFDFDNWESQFDDELVEENPIDSDQDREPSSQSKSQVADTLKSVGKTAIESIGPGIGDKIGREMYHTSSFIGDAMNVASDAVRLKDNFTREITPSINQIKRAGQLLAPKLKNFMPKTWHDKLTDVLKTEESGMRGVSVEEARNTATAQMIESVFAKEQEIHAEEVKEDRAERMVDRSLESSRHKELTQVVDEIRIGVNLQSRFTQTSFTAYLKKDLELKYKHLLVAQDTLSVTQVMAKALEEKLEQVRHNTALPDVQKEKKLEVYKGVAAGAMASRINDRLYNWGKTIIGNMKQSVFDPLKSSIERVASGAEMASSMAETLSGFEDMPGGGPDVSATAVAGDIGGALAGQWLGGKAGKYILSKASPYARNVEDIMSSMKMRLALKTQKAADNSEYGTLSSWLLNILAPGISRAAPTLTNPMMKPDEQVPFDVATRQSIIEVIPGYLAKILQQVTSLSTGRAAEELVYDNQKRDFVGQTQFRNELIERAFGTKEEHASNLGYAVGALRGAYVHHGHQDITSFDNVGKDVARLLNNAAMRKHELEPEVIKSVADGTSIENEQYTRDLFVGIKDPEAVAKVLVSSLYRDAETVNQQALTEINNYVLGLMTKDEYLTKIPGLANTLGYARHFGDFLKTRGGVFVLNQDKVAAHQSDLDEERFRSTINYKSRSAKSRLDDDLRDKQATHDVVRGLGEQLTGNALRTEINDLTVPDMQPGSGTEEEDSTKSPRSARSWRGVRRPATPLKAVSETAPTGAPTRVALDTRQPLAVRVLESAPVEIRLPMNFAPLKVDVVSAQMPFDVNVIKDSTRPPELPEETRRRLAHGPRADYSNSAPPAPVVAHDTTSVVTAIQALENKQGDQQERMISLLEIIAHNTKSSWNSITDFTKEKLGGIGGLLGKGLKLPFSFGAWSLQKQLELARWAGGQVKNTAGLALGGAKSIAGLAGSAIGGVAKGVGNAALGTLGLGLDMTGGLLDTLTGIPERLKTSGARVRGLFSRGKKSLKDAIFVDIYKKDEVVPGEPLLSQKKQQEGVVFASGSPVRTSYSITEPVLDPETQQTLITKEDIEHGLVDVQGNPLSVKDTLMGKAFAVHGKAAKAVGSLASGASKLGGKLLGAGGSLLGMIPGAVKGLLNMGNPFMQLYAQAAGLTLKGIGAIGKGAGTLVGRMLGMDVGKDRITEKSLQKIVGDRLDDIYDLLYDRLPDRTIAGDNDGDGDRDGSYADQMAQKKEKRKSGESTEGAEEAKDGVKKLGLLAAIKAKLGGGDKEATPGEEGGSGIMDYLKYKLADKFGGKALTALRAGGGMLMGAGRSALGWLTGAGAAGASALGAEAALGGGALATGATTAAATTAATAATAGAATTAATGAVGTGAAAAGTILGGPPAWIAGAVVLTALGSYAAYKYFGTSDKEKSLLEMRSDAYGTDLAQSTGIFSRSMSSKVLALEEATVAILDRKARPMTDADLEAWTDKFGLDSSDKEQVQYWTTWYRQRFVPVLQIYKELLERVGLTYSSSDNLTEKQEDSLRKLFIQATSSHIYKINTLVPTPEAFKKFQGTLKRNESEEQKRTERESKQETDQLADEVATDNATTRSKAYAVDPAYSRAARDMSKEDEAENRWQRGDARRPEIGTRVTPNQMMLPVPGQSAPGVVDQRGPGARFGHQIGEGRDAPDVPQSNELGALSAIYESGKKGSSAIGYDTQGGTSYGKYQIASNTGTFRNFLSWLDTQGPEGEEVADRLRRAGPANTLGTTGKVPDEWKKLASEGKLGNFEHDFIRDTHYVPAIRGLPKDIQAIVKDNKVLQDVVWSTSVQHGPGRVDDIFRAAYRKGMEPAEFIRGIYNERARVFPPTARRYSEEASKALAMLQGGGAKPPTETAAAGEQLGKTEVAAAGVAVTATTAPTTGTSPATAPSTPSSPATPAATATGPEPAATTPVATLTNAASAPKTPSGGSTGDATATPVAVMTQAASPVASQPPKPAVAPQSGLGEGNVATLLQAIVDQVAQLNQSLVSIFGTGQVFTDILNAVQQSGGTGDSKVQSVAKKESSNAPVQKTFANTTTTATAARIDYQPPAVNQIPDFSAQYSQLRPRMGATGPLPINVTKPSAYATGTAGD